MVRRVVSKSLVDCESFAEGALAGRRGAWGQQSVFKHVSEGRTTRTKYGNDAIGGFGTHDVDFVLRCVLEEEEETVVQMSNV